MRNARSFSMTRPESLRSPIRPSGRDALAGQVLRFSRCSNRTWLLLVGAAKQRLQRKTSAGKLGEPVVGSIFRSISVILVTGIPLISEC